MAVGWCRLFGSVLDERRKENGIGSFASCGCHQATFACGIASPPHLPSKNPNFYHIQIITMKVATVLALTLASASAFAPASPAFARSSALRLTPEEDLELTRKVIQDFAKGGSSPKEPEPEPEPKKEEVAAAKEE